MVHFIDIGDLRLKSHALSRMKKYPKQMRFTRVNMTTLPTETFAGLHSVDQLLFHHVSVSIVSAIESFLLAQVHVKRVEARAFGQVSSVKYIYWRQSVIGNIDNEAFGGMQQVGRLILREDVHIGMWTQRALSGSTVRRIVSFAKAQIPHRSIKCN